MSNIVVWGHDEQFAAWAVGRIKYMEPSIGFGPCKAAAVATGDTPQDRLLAVIVYHAYDKPSRTVQMSIAAASPRWATRDTIRGLLAVPFEQWHCRKVWSVVASNNDRAQKLALGLGFKKEANLRHQMAHGVHAVILGLMEDEYRKIWSAPRLVQNKHPTGPRRLIGVKHGQEVRAIAA